MCRCSPSTRRDARDHDDAVWAELDTATGGCNIIVAIADVAAYVRPGTALDREARIRGNSVYFPDRVVPMLPERISNDLCSLREKEERPALACFMSFDKSGRKTKHRFERVIMRSAAKLAYEEAQAAIDGQPNDKTSTLLEPVLKPLWAAYAILKKGRDAREPLELDLPERKLILDAHGLIERVVTPDRLDAHKLIEEFMIQANVAAAEELENRKVAAAVPHPRAAVRGKGPGAGRIPAHRGPGPAAWPGHETQAFQQVAGAGSGKGLSASGQ